MVWCVVHFVLDNTVEVVPGFWYAKGNCAWPRSSKTKDIKKAIFNQVRPNKLDFSFFEARCLSSNIDSFSKAQKKCEMAKGKSDLSSTEEDKLKKKKIRRQNRVCLQSDSEQSDTLSDMNQNSIPCYHSADSDSSPNKNIIVADNQNIKFLRQDIVLERRPDGWSPLKVSKNNNIIPIPRNKSDNGSVIMSPLKTSKYTSSSQSHGVKRSLFDDINKSPNSNDSSLTACTPNNSIINDDQYARLLNYMLTIKYEIKSIHEKLDIIIQRDEENTLTKTRESQLLYDTCLIDDKLPIKSQENLQEFENELYIDKIYRHQLVKRLSSVGGKSIKIMVKRIMTLMFTPELLCKFSYNGRGNKKCSFEKLLVNKIIFESVKTIKKFAASDNSTNEIEQVIKYVLIQTPFKIRDKTVK
ncbi:uncharacterized protein LOC132936033 [Metopolophium dirhodum]|uniref:uncharacterized protein LOC132936033 n=1 Tax=Metopolophium dirhodum TaxID=44670 RepID=UPI002990529D|nr:uncharacterized protein LOC132936033 [Metopolophium dirhodum]